MSTLVELQYRQDTAANWTAQNPVLAAGEPAYETDTGKVKVGDGTTAWNDLTYNTSIDHGTSLPDPADYNDGDVFLLRS